MLPLLAYFGLIFAIEDFVGLVTLLKADVLLELIAPPPIVVVAFLLG